MKRRETRKSIARLEVVKVRERTEPYGRVIGTSKDVKDFADAAIWRRGEPPNEEFWIILLDNRNRVLGTSMVARGSINECQVQPREVFTPLLLTGAANVILVHNHPSGDPSPSSEDRALTVRMGEAGRLLGARVLDHVIWTRKNFCSLIGEGR